MRLQRYFSARMKQDSAEILQARRLARGLQRSFLKVTVKRKAGCMEHRKSLTTLFSVRVCAIAIGNPAADTPVVGKTTPALKVVRKKTTFRGAAVNDIPDKIASAYIVNCARTRERKEVCVVTCS